MREPPVDLGAPRADGRPAAPRLLRAALARRDRVNIIASASADRPRAAC